MGDVRDVTPPKVCLETENSGKNRVIWAKFGFINLKVGQNLSVTGFFLIYILELRKQDYSIHGLNGYQI